MRHRDLTSKIISLAFEVHANLGPGLMESAYEACLDHELIQAGYDVKRQTPIDIPYRDLVIHAGYTADFIVNELVLIELKAVTELTDLHLAQVITYLKLSKLEVGLLINFNVRQLKTGIRRVSNWNYRHRADSVPHLD